MPLPLPEAYNLQEMQQFQETQVNLQEEANALQVDIARPAQGVKRRC